MRADVSRPLDLTLPIASNDVAHPYAPLSVDVDITGPAYDLSVPTASDVAYTLPPGNVDVAGPAYEPAPLTVIDIACTPGPSSVDVPGPIDASVHRPMPPMGVRPPKSSVPIDVVKPSSGPAPPTRDVVGQPDLGRPTSVDVTSYPGLPSASVGAVRQPHSSSMGADVVRSTPTRADVVHPSSMGIDVTRPMPLGGTHPPSMGARVVGPTPAHVAHPPSAQLGSSVDVASRPTLADPRSDPPRPRPAHTSQYAAVSTGVQVQTPVETLSAQSLLLLGRRTASPQSSSHSSVHEWLQASRTAAPPPSPAGSMSSSSSELQQVFASGAEAAMAVPPSARSSRMSRASRHSVGSSLAMEVFGYSMEMTGHMMQMAQAQLNQVLAQAEAQRAEARQREEAQRVEAQAQRAEAMKREELALAREQMLARMKAKTEEASQKREESIRSENLAREELLIRMKTDADRTNAERERVVTENDFKRQKMFVDTNAAIQREKMQADLQKDIEYQQFQQKERDKAIAAQQKLRQLAAQELKERVHLERELVKQQQNLILQKQRETDRLEAQADKFFSAGTG